MNAALEKLILEVLSVAHPNMMRERTLIADVLIADDRQTHASIKLGLRSLESRTEVVGIPHADGTLWKIAPNGTARLAGA